MMETPKKKKHDLQPRTSFWQQYYPLIIALVILAILISYNAVLQNIFADSSTVFYPLLRWGHILNTLIIFLVFPIISVSLIGKIIKRNRAKNRNAITIWNDLIALVLLIFAGVSQCGYIVGSLVTSDTYKHRDSLHVNDNIYMLTQRIIFDAYLGDGVLLIYQCDSMGLFCTEILEKRSLFGRIETSELAFNEATQEISFLVDGERFTYQLE